MRPLKKGDRIMIEKRGKGYIGKSMSVNAKNAYNNDEMPLSNWRKEKFVELLELNFDLEVKSIKGGVISST